MQIRHNLPSPSDYRLSLELDVLQKATVAYLVGFKICSVLVGYLLKPCSKKTNRCDDNVILMTLSHTSTQTGIAAVHVLEILFTKL